MIARNCGDFNKSNVFFDAAEESYKYDVDLENVGSKAAKFVGTTLLNDTKLIMMVLYMKELWLIYIKL